jgi:hypothetical protein
VAVRTPLACSNESSAPEARVPIMAPSPVGEGTMT